MEKVWESVRDEIYTIIQSVRDIEIGCNICTHDGEKFYVSDISFGSNKIVYIPINPYTVGTFHTHVNGTYIFSTGDIRSSVKNKERFVFLGNEYEVYGFDMNDFSRSVKKVISKEKTFKWLARKINSSKLKHFDYAKLFYL